MTPNGHYIRGLETQSPPSSYAISAVFDGEPGAWTRVAFTTALRSGFIAPGLYLSGARGKQLLFGSLLGSVSITAFLFLYYGIKRKFRMPVPSSQPGDA